MSMQWPYYYYYYNSYNHPYYQMQSNQQPLPEKVEQENLVDSPTEQMGVSEQLNQIYQLVSKIEADYQEIKKDIEKMDTFTVENVNYKIQDLNVQDLSGNLLVGLTTLSDAENLKKILADEDDSVTFNDIDTEAFEGPEMDWEQENNNENG